MVFNDAMKDKDQIAADRALLKQLGGPTRVADILGFDKANGGIQRVQNWMTRGIPSEQKVERPDLFMRPLVSRNPRRRSTDKTKESTEQ